MSKSAPKLLLDEDVQILVATLLRADGFTVETVTGLNRKGYEDSEQLEFARQKGYAILTFNRTDFEELAVEYFEQGRSHYGIIISVQRSPKDVTSKLLDLLEKFTQEEMIDQIYYI